MPSRGFHTDCVRGPLLRAFRGLGASVGSRPWPFLLVPFLLSGALATGFVFLPLHNDTDLERQFTPTWGPAKKERRRVQAHFPTDDARRFSAQSLSTDGSFASFIAVAARDGDSLLTRAAFAELLALDRAVRGIRVAGLSFDHFCARNDGSCVSPNPLLSAVRGNPAEIETLLPHLTFPVFRGRLFLGFFLGGVTLGPGAEPARPLLAARALRLIYFLQADDTTQRDASTLWLEAFLERVPRVLRALNLTALKVTYFTSLSKQKEFDRIVQRVVPLISITYFLTMLFSVISCARLDCIRTKVWIASSGALTAGLSTVSSFGLLLFCGVPFVITTVNSPFLILGVGVDDMFIFVSRWQQTKVKDSVKDRMADTYAEAAVSVTITTLTDVLAFYIGSEASFVSVQSFCIYTGTAFMFCYIYNLTFLGAVFALNGRREESNRHWLTFMKVKREPTQSLMYNMCCIGGFFDESTGAEIDHPMNNFFRMYYGPFLMHIWTKVFVVVLYLIYLGTSIYGCTQITEELHPRNVAIDDSYVVPYYDWEDEHFSKYGPKVMVIMTESIAYWDPLERRDFEECMKDLESLSFTDRSLSESWLRIYQSVTKHLSLNIDDHNKFIANLPTLFSINPESQWNVKLNDKEILVSRFFIQTVNIKNGVDKKQLLNQLRHTARNCKIPLKVYHPTFIYFDQFRSVVYYTIRKVVIASVIMFLICLLLIPKPVPCLWVTFTVTSVTSGVAGFMAYWQVHLDSVSMIMLITCIGFSVDSSAHISYSFVLSNKCKVSDKVVDALYLEGYPALQSTISTIVGITVLSVTPIYFCRIFFKIMFLVMFWGAVHSLIFIPVFLTFFYPYSGKVEESNNQALPA